MTITQQEIQKLTKPQCLKKIQELDAEYDFDLTWSRQSHSESTLMSVVDTLLYLEDRIRFIDLQAISQNALAAKNAIAKPGGRRPFIMTPRGLCKNINKAAEVMGVSKGSIVNWLKTKPTEYYRQPQNQVDLNSNL